MRPAVLLVLLLLAACHRSSSSSEPVLGSAVIGPDGGELAITGGVQAGLRLTIPPGAVATPTEFRIFDVSTPIYLAENGPVYAAPPAQPFRIEPQDLRLDVLATLQAPYQVPYVYGTAPGNVRARQVRNGNSIDLAPTQVDVSAGHIVLRTRTLGSFQVVKGPAVPGVNGYQQAIGASVALADGYSFAVEAVPSTSPFAATDAVCWHITGFGIDDRIYFQGDSVVGRESATATWRERWTDSFPVWSNGPYSLVGSFTTTTQVEQPIGGPAIGGSMSANGGWYWTDPRLLGTELLYDVLTLRLNLAWNRVDLGVGQRAYVFTFAPGRGLLALSQDGVEHARLP